LHFAQFSALLCVPETFTCFVALFSKRSEAAHLKVPKNVTNVNFVSDERLKPCVLNADKFVNDEHITHKNITDVQISHG